MMNGEISGYAHYLQTAYCIPKRVLWVPFVWHHLHVLALAEKTWQAVSGEHEAALSAMHAKAHSWSF